jgi:Family of unknown function (DUF6188)
MASAMTSTVGIQESGNTAKLPIVGREVSRLVLDFRLTLQFLDTGADYDIAIATPFSIEDGKRTHRLDPERPESLGPALTVLRRVVESAAVNEDGGLVLAFAHGLTLRVVPDPNYEAWESTSSSGAKLVCLPGGGLAVWAARD